MRWPQGNRAGIALVLVSMVIISVNDMAVKVLAADYPLYQIVFTRSAIGILFTLVFVRFEGGLSILKTARPGLHLLRAMLLVAANLFFFAGLAALPLAETSALFFVAPLLITLLAIPVLGERVGARRLGACAVGFLGVLVMLRPGGLGDAPAWASGLPILAALCYAGTQVLTRKLGVSSRASALSFYIQACFLIVGAVFGLTLGSGWLVEGMTNPSLVFVLRAWVWPAPGDWAIFGTIGVIVGFLGYCMSQAYRLGEPATVAPFEYVALPLAVLLGYIVFGEVPDLRSWLGMALIAGAGIYVFLRERTRSPRAPRPLRRG